MDEIKLITEAVAMSACFLYKEEPKELGQSLLDDWYKAAEHDSKHGTYENMLALIPRAVKDNTPKEINNISYILDNVLVEEDPRATNKRLTRYRDIRTAICTTAFNSSPLTTDTSSADDLSPEEFINAYLMVSIYDSIMQEITFCEGKFLKFAGIKAAGLFTEKEDYDAVIKDLGSYVARCTSSATGHTHFKDLLDKYRDMFNETVAKVSETTTRSDYTEVDLPYWLSKVASMKDYISISDFKYITALADSNSFINGNTVAKALRLRPTTAKITVDDLELLVAKYNAVYLARIYAATKIAEKLTAMYKNKEYIDGLRYPTDDPYSFSVKSLSFHVCLYYNNDGNYPFSFLDLETTNELNTPIIIMASGVDTYSGYTLGFGAWRFTFTPCMRFDSIATDDYKTGLINKFISSDTDDLAYDTSFRVSAILAKDRDDILTLLCRHKGEDDSKLFTDGLIPSMSAVVHMIIGNLTDGPSE